MTHFFCFAYATCALSGHTSLSGAFWLGGVTKHGFELQDGTFLVLQPEAIAHNVSRSLPTTGYTFFPGVNVYSQYDLLPVNKTTGGLTCRTGPSASNINITLMDQCAYATSCCIDTATYQVGNCLPSSLASLIMDTRSAPGLVMLVYSSKNVRRLAYVALCKCDSALGSVACLWCFGILLLELLVAGVLYTCEVARSTAPSMQSSKDLACTKLAVMCRVRLCQKSWPEFAMVSGSMTQSARVSVTTAHLDVRTSRGSHQTLLLIWIRHATSQVYGRGY